MGQTDWSLDRGTSFTRCTAERIAETNPNTGAPIFPGCQGTSEGALLTASPLSLPGVLRSGDVRNYALGVRGGGDQYSFYANVSHDLEQGVNLNSEFGRSSARANFTFNPMDQLDFQVNFNYVHDRTSMPNGNNAGTIIQNALIWVPGAAGLSRNQVNDTFRDQEEQFSAYENWLRGDHAIFGTTVNYRPATWFVNRFTVGADVASREAQRWIAPGSAYSPTTGQLTQGSPKNTIYTVDYAGTISNDLTSALTSALSFGAQYNYSKYQNSVAQGSDFPSSTTKDIAFSTFQTGWTELSEVKKLGFYGQEQIGWNDRLFLTGALRVDNSSVFGSDIKQIYYPKVSASYVISEEPFFRNYSWIDQLRLRAAWGQAGNSPGPFAAIQTYTFTQTTDPTTGVKGLALVRNTKGNPDVKPERGSEIEAGFDLGLLGGRLGGEFTYYDKTTSDALVSVALPPSQGWAVPSYLANLGTIKNSGVEMSLNATPVQSRILTWDAQVGFSTNSNELAGFGLPDTTRLQQPFGLTALVQRNVVGYPLGGYWVRDPVLTDGGDPTQPGDYVGGPMRYLGPSMPTRQGSLSSTFTILGNVTLYALFDYRGGNYLYNHSRDATCQARVCEAVNDADVPEAEKAKLLAGIQTNTALYTEKADFVKFRNLSLTYTLPRGFSERFGSDRASITLAGQNLGFLYKPYTGFDPETNFIGINDPGAQWAGVRVDYWNQPMLRRITASLDVTF
ncbi:MAG TPA: TonB-dependent receptor [Longimicrobiaceae bacterium]|nr:TonB-dependent receptor [Longimicrobiaceae bacterium]